MTDGQVAQHVQQAARRIEGESGHVQVDAEAVEAHQDAYTHAIGHSRPF
jgi:hypothetical protein